MDRRYDCALRQGRPRHEPYDEFSLRHPKMQLGQRAKIFSPFDALKGFGEAIAEKLERYVEKRELTEEEQAALDACLGTLSERTQNGRTRRERPVHATALYYVPCADENHEAYGRLGQYRSVTGTVVKVDALRRTLRLGDTVLDFSDLAELRIEEEEETDNVLPILYGDVAEAEADCGAGAQREALHGARG